MQYSSSFNQTMGEIANTPLMRYIVKQGPALALIGLVRKKGRKISRSRRRKFLNRKRRWFTDNIVMHHRRLHKKNREIVIDTPEESNRKRKLKRKKEKKGKEKEKKPNKIAQKWQSGDEIKHRGTRVRGRIDARRLKAKSRWLSVAG